jgi:hypothetical protein
MILAAAASLAVVQPVPQPVEPPLPPPGRTTLEISRDPIDDSVRAFVVYRSGEARLTVGCNRDRFDGVRVALWDAGWFAPRFFVGRRSVRYRFDAARPRSTLWRADEGAVYLRGRSRVRGFLRWLAASQSFAIRAKDVEDRRREFVFSTAGSRPQIEGMLEACGETRLREAIAAGSGGG